jgi:aspartate beta-hydroxylase
MSDSEFSEAVVAVLKKQFGDEETERVVDLWRRKEAGVEHSETIGTHPLMVQQAPIYFEGLTAAPKPVWPNAEVAWAAALEDGWQTVRAELEEVLRKDAAELEAAGSEGWVSPVEFGAGEAYGMEWKTLGLVERGGRWDPANSALFPETCQLLRQSEAPLMEAFIAKMPAGTKILPHSDGCNAVLTASLGLIVPESGCRLNVGDATCAWTEGGMFLFDSSILHEAVNESDEDRYALVMRVWHPELTAAEIQALTYAFDCIEQRYADEWARRAQKPNLEEPAYYIEIEKQAWKIPGGVNIFDASIFGDDVALFDVEDQTYAGFDEGRKCFIQPNKKYARHRMLPQEIVHLSTRPAALDNTITEEDVMDVEDVEAPTAPPAPGMYETVEEIEDDPTYYPPDVDMPDLGSDMSQWPDDIALMREPKKPKEEEEDDEQNEEGGVWPEGSEKDWPEFQGPIGMGPRGIDVGTDGGKI